MGDKVRNLEGKPGVVLQVRADGMCLVELWASRVPRRIVKVWIWPENLYHRG